MNLFGSIKPSKPCRGNVMKQYGCYLQVALVNDTTYSGTHFKMPSAFVVQFRHAPFRHC